MLQMPERYMAHPSRAMSKLLPAALLLTALLIASETRAMPFSDAPTPKRWQPPGLYITVYDWGLGGQNCFWDEAAGENICTHTALMVPTGDDLMGWVAACPSAWLGRVTTTVVTIWGEDFVCIDAFGRPEDRELTRIDGRSVYRIDIAYRPAAEHPWNNEHVPAGQWSRGWLPMWAFEARRQEVENQ